ncbi:unnamed protein product [Pleuronectes platessa]|uniref:Uncharacterized protein n=1 Tax=Pleuronectes platessa TaxID=8262 RepID=A0A9N7TKP7_PLEPL|nr:unnamed protein product [Pleuronectes platessa]
MESMKLKSPFLLSSTLRSEGRVCYGAASPELSPALPCSEGGAGSSYGTHVCRDRISSCLTDCPPGVLDASVRRTPTQRQRADTTTTVILGIHLWRIQSSCETAPCVIAQQRTPPTVVNGNPLTEQNQLFIRSRVHADQRALSF